MNQDQFSDHAKIAEILTQTANTSAESFAALGQGMRLVVLFDQFEQAFKELTIALQKELKTQGRMAGDANLLLTANAQITEVRAGADNAVVQLRFLPPLYSLEARGSLGTARLEHAERGHLQKLAAAHPQQATGKASVATLNNKAFPGPEECRAPMEERL